MAIKVSTFYWDNSPQKGTLLLLLLALADNANADTGVAFPGIKHLASKIRVSERQTQILIRKLAEAGELLVEHGKGLQTGHGATNRYQLLRYQQAVLGATPDTPADAPPNRSAGVRPVSPLGVNPTAPRSEPGVNPTSPQGVNPGSPLGVNPTSPKPLVEPSVEPKDKRLSPRGETVFINSNSNETKPKSALQEAVASAFAIQPGGFAGTLGAQLTGTAQKGQRAEWQIDPPMTPAEITGFGLWYNHVYGDNARCVTPPTTAETLHDRVLQFRDHPKHRIALQRGEEKLRQRLGQPDPPPAVVAARTPEDDRPASPEALAEFEQMFAAVVKMFTDDQEQ